jgi:hypothetical protein
MSTFRNLMITVAALALITTTQAAHATDKQTFIGDWMLLTKSDPITDRQTAIAYARGAPALVAFRCMSGEWSVAFALDRTTFKLGDTFSFDIRVDKQAVFSVEGTAVDTEFVEIAGMSQDLLSQLSTGKRLVVRFTNKYSHMDYEFQIAGAAKALAPVISACPPAVQAETTPAPTPAPTTAPWLDPRSGYKGA